MDSPEKPKKKYKLLFTLIILLALSALILYILDSFIFPKRVGVHFTDDPKERERIARSEGDEEDIDPEKKPSKPNAIKISDPSELSEGADKKSKIKSTKEMGDMLKLSLSSTELADWDYNIEKAKTKKLNKRIYSKAELEDWDVDMLGRENASRLSLGVEEFMKKPEEVKEEEKPKDAGEEVEDKELLDAAMEEEGLKPEVEGETPSPTPVATAEPKKEEKPKESPRERIDPYSYKMISFMPGHANGGFFMDYSGFDYQSAASGKPDFVDSRANNPEIYKEEVLPLGHGGVVEYEVIGGEIIDGDGPDFVIYADSAFTDSVETAKIEVSQSGRSGSYVEFPCDSVNPPYTGCAGIHPVRAGTSDDPLKVGGDAFDLSKIGLKKIRFIRIADTGDNNNSSDMQRSDGADLDSIALIHAYKLQ